LQTIVHVVVTEVLAGFPSNLATPLVTSTYSTVCKKILPSTTVPVVDER
jgi:hypothetical protein